MRLVLLITLFISTSAFAEPPLLETLFDDAKRGSLATSNKALSRDAAPRRQENRAEKLRDFWKFYANRVPSDSPLSIHQIDSKALLFHQAEVWDFNGDGRDDFFVTFNVGTGHCSRYVLIVSQGGTYEHYDGDDLIGFSSDDSTFCDPFFSSMHPYRVPGKSRHIAIWVFSYSDGNNGVYREFDFSKPKGSSVTGELKFEIDEMLDGFAQDRQEQCLTPICLKVLDIVPPFLEEIVNELKFKNSDQNQYDTSVLGNSSIGFAEVLEAVLNTGNDYTAKWVDKVTPLKLDINNDGYEDELFGVHVRAATGDERRLYWAISEGKENSFLRLGQSIGHEVMLENPKTPFSRFGQTGERLAIFDYAGRNYVLKVARDRMGWRVHCCGAGIYEIQGTEVIALEHMSITPRYSYILSRVSD